MEKKRGRKKERKLYEKRGNFYLSIECVSKVLAKLLVSLRIGDGKIHLQTPEVTLFGKICFSQKT